MIHHISIPARNPRHVANVLAEVLDGRVSLFSPNVNSYVVWIGDQYGTMIEVYPQGNEAVTETSVHSSSLTSIKNLILSAVATLHQFGLTDLSLGRVNRFHWCRPNFLQ